MNKALLPIDAQGHYFPLARWNEPSAGPMMSRSTYSVRR